MANNNYKIIETRTQKEKQKAESLEKNQKNEPKK